MQGNLIVIFFVVSLILFFWSIFKAVKTQQTKYAWGMLPFLLFMFGIFLI
jgi:flagellar basal body-associated protein FliL